MRERKPRIYPTKRNTFVVTYPLLVNGKWKRRQREFSDKEEAHSYFGELERRFPVVGSEGLAMDHAQRADYHAAREILPSGVSLSDAARFYVSANPVGESILAEDAAREWLDFASRTDRSARTGKDRRNILNRFLNESALVWVGELDSEVCERWLWSCGSNRTIIQCASVLRGFCKWLVQRKRALPSNPIDQVPLPSGDDPTPRTLDASQVRDLLKAAIAWRKGAMVPFFAIAILAGLRPSEITRLEAGQIRADVSEPFIRVRKLKRGRGVRLAPISDTLKAWLASYPPEFPVYFSKKGFETIRKNAGLLAGWQGDVMRHTWISAMLATGRDESDVARWAGNTPKIIHTYYKDLLTREEGESILSVKPQPKEL